MSPLRIECPIDGRVMGHWGDPDFVIALARHGAQPYWQNALELRELDPWRTHQLAQLQAHHDQTSRSGKSSTLSVRCRSTSTLPSFSYPAQTITSLYLEHLDIAQHALKDKALLLSSSTWVTEQLKQQGITSVITLPPGFDPSRFHPAPIASSSDTALNNTSSSNVPPLSAPLIFSCGTLDEHAGLNFAGLDIVVAAFRTLLTRHPEAKLLYRWLCGDAQHHGIRQLAHSPYVSPLTLKPDDNNLMPWLIDNGIPEEALVDCRQATLDQLPGLLNASHMAVFPTRWCGHGDAMALAAMACGTPTILTGHTGHLDWLGEHAYVLKPTRHIPTWPAHLTGAREPDPLEVVFLMERVLSRPREVQQKRLKTAQFALRHSHEAHAQQLLDAIEHIRTPRQDHETVKTQYQWAVTLHRAGCLQEAERIYTQVLQYAPQHFHARGNRGKARHQMGQLIAAEDDFKTAQQLAPHKVETWQSLGHLYRQLGQMDNAIACHRQALQIEATPHRHWELAYTLLSAGQYAQAWPHFEHRHAYLKLRAPGPHKPRWTGNAYPQYPLLVLDEQGIGDSLQCLRFLNQIPQNQDPIIFAGKSSILPIVKMLAPLITVVDWDKPLPHFASWVPLMSLPACLGVATPEQLPPPMPPQLDPSLYQKWTQRVRAQDQRPVVGICWRGNPYFSNDQIRSPGLEALRPLLMLSGIRFVSLQVGVGRYDMAHAKRNAVRTDIERGDPLEPGDHFELTDIGGQIEQEGAHIQDTLAALSACDLVITSCTSLVHMTGLMQKPGWLLLSHSPDWRWMTGRTDTPWYPSLRLFRQPAPNDWAGIVQQVMTALTQWRDQYAQTHASPGTQGNVNAKDESP